MKAVTSVVRTPLAAEDLIEIYHYITAHSPRAAETLLYGLDGEFRLLAERPGIGRARPELRPELRSWSHGSYVILYRIVDAGVEIVRVIHGARDLAAVLNEASRGNNEPNEL